MVQQYIFLPLTIIIVTLVNGAPYHVQDEPYHVQDESYHVQDATYRVQDAYGALLDRLDASNQDQTRQSQTIHNLDTVHEALSFFRRLKMVEHPTNKRDFPPRHTILSSSSSSKEKEFRKHRIQAEVDCPLTADGVKQYACPSKDEFSGEFTCIDDHMLCDNVAHCPNHEDEDATVCMFHRMTMNYFRLLLDAVFGLTRSIV